ncbi:MAG TPA: peptide ligase PGM1-related protein [Chitinophagaceae bacterium]|nr:peptide ligase PGM1-related protein [Chitinophagaceae bacterium]
METLYYKTGIDTDRTFAELQERFAKHFHEIFLNDLAEKTIVIIPSLTLDNDMLKTLKGVVHYEERLLCFLMLLRMPRTQVIYVTSIPIDNSIIDYYIHLLPGITGYHARQRLTMLSCFDASRKPLTEKILDRPRLIRRIRQQIRFPEMAHLACFNVTDLEKQLALALDIPVYGCNPRLSYLGTKSGSRKIFRKVGIPVPTGIEDLGNEDDIADALCLLKKNNPALQKAVIKMNDGFSGEGNAVFYYNEIDAENENARYIIRQRMPHYLKAVAMDVSHEQYIQKFRTLGGIAEEFIEAQIKKSPSVQCRINPIGHVDIISTHDQFLGGESEQVFLGSSFPASDEYNKEIAVMGKMIAQELQAEGVLGRFSIDFISVKEPVGWKHYAIEINLRKGGTTHPFLMLQFLTGGEFNWREGVYAMPNGQQRCYFASDNVVNENYKGLTPHDLIDIAMCNGILYDSSKQTGVMFHMIGAVSQYGKLGLVCIGQTVDEAKEIFEKTINVLDKECSR